MPHQYDRVPPSINVIDCNQCNNAGVLSVAIEMANVHNLLLRGLNSIYLQAPMVIEPTDIADFMLYIKAWVDTVHHHHLAEESMLFPEIEKIAQEAKGIENVMSANISQHHLFESKLIETAKYAQDVSDKKEKYDSKRLKMLIDEFAPVLTQHLHEEIETLLKLEDYDGTKISKAMKDCAEEGGRTADPVCVNIRLSCM